MPQLRATFRVLALVAVVCAGLSRGAGQPGAPHGTTPGTNEPGTKPGTKPGKPPNAIVPDNIPHCGADGVWRNGAVEAMKTGCAPLDDATLAAALSYLATKPYKTAALLEHDERGHIADWDVSRVTTLAEAFVNANDAAWAAAAKLQRTAGLDVSGWDVSAVTDTTGTFQDCAACFSGGGDWNLNAWNTSGVTSISMMFFGAGYFNKDVSGWDVSTVRVASRGAGWGGAGCWLPRRSRSWPGAMPPLIPAALLLLFFFWFSGSAAGVGHVGRVWRA